ncbi:MAG: hypothetical protein HYU74_03325 [Dechloromonas sp.]|nr:hypothetical protein [Dechloromonas sp.]
MKSAKTPDSDAIHDPLVQYASAVQGLHTKLHRIRSNQQDVAASLGRAALALRSIATARTTPPNPAFKNDSSNLRESVSRAPSCTWQKLLICPEG